jgi:glyoxylate/hydroxypyruvate reductase A
MGLGYLGKKTAKTLHALGLKVNGWSTSAKNIENINCYVGKTEFAAFLQQTDILICMLPLTPATHNILNHHTFSALRKNAYLIHVGRGHHLVEQDLLTALKQGQLCGAVLDVFASEPLPTNHPFWQHPQIRITPHIASVTNPTTAAIQVVENIHRVLGGGEPNNKVDLVKGY